MTTGHQSRSAVLEDLQNKANLLVTKDTVLAQLTPLDIFKDRIKDLKRIGGMNPRIHVKSDNALVSLYAEKALLKIKMHRYYKLDESWGIGPANSHDNTSERNMEREMRELQYLITSEEDELFAQIEHTFNQFST